ncbi:MAG TPA: 5-oxoprolinase subunit PxpA [Candidatus Limnocylindrales bacterium]|nr:5-oxoprolinase subunit PxpA [Candidatus Limnocylindrales bacterium]
MTRRIDLNADVGEGFGAWSIGEDDALVPLITSANVACGAHAGDPVVIERTVRLAARHGVALGAHPGYPDLAGFGRRELAMDAHELETSILYQVGAVLAFTRDAGVELRHVKPHGALYNRSARDAAVAETIARAVARVSRALVLVGLAGSVSLEAARAAGLGTASEAFADRAYEPDGSLRSRSLAGAVLDDPDACARQAVAIAREGRVEAFGGGVVTVEAATICVHGDRPGAASRARAVRVALEAAGVELRPLGA